MKTTWIVARTLPEFIRALLFVGIAFAACPLACVGFYLAPTTLFRVVDDGYAVRSGDARWAELPASPDPIVELLGAGRSVVYGVDGNGHVWSCRVASVVDRDCWRSVPSLPTQAPRWICSNQVRLESAETIIAETHPTGSRILAWTESVYCETGIGGKGYVSRFVYALTDTGRVWQLAYDGAGVVNRQALQASWVGVGLIGVLMVGLLVAAVLLVLYRLGPWQRKRTVRSSAG